MKFSHILFSILLSLTISACFFSPKKKQTSNDVGFLNAKLIEKSALTKPIWGERQDNFFEDGNAYYFIGRSEGAKKYDSARKKSFADALSHFSNFFGITVYSEFTETARESAGEYSYQVDLYSKHKGTRILLKKYRETDFYYEVYNVDGEQYYKSMLLVEIPKEEMSRIEKNLNPAQNQKEWLTQLKGAVQGMLKGVESSKGKKIAVGSFTDNRKRLSELSALIAEQVEMTVINSSKGMGYEIIEKKELQQYMSSWGIQTRGVATEADRAQAGKLLGIDIFCFGSYTVFGGNISLNMKLLDTKSGKIIAGVSEVLNTDQWVIDMSNKYIDDYSAVASSGSAGSLNVSENADFTRAEADVENEKVLISSAQNEEGINIKLWTSKKEFNEGDIVKFYVKTDQDCYLSLIHVNASGEVSVLFPNYYDPTNFVEGGKVYSVPSENADFQIEASPPFGQEIIRAVASKTPLKDISSLESGAQAKKTDESNPFGDFIDDAAVFTRGLSVAAKGAKKGEWAEAVIKIRISP